MTQAPYILVVDQDAVAADALVHTLKDHGYACMHAGSAEHAMESLDRAQASTDRNIGVVLIDQDCSGPAGGIELARRLQEDRPAVVPIVVSGFGKVELAVKAMRCGAADYLIRPVIETDLLDAVQRAVQRHLLFHEPAPEPTTLNQESVDPAESCDRPPQPTAAATAMGWQAMPLAEALKEPERQILLAALDANGWNRGETARQLDINRTTLYKKIRQYRLDEPV